MSKDPKKDEILGLNLDNWLKDNDATIHGVSQSNDIPIIEELTQPHNKIKEILTKRMNSLKSLSNTWKKGNIGETIKELSLIKDKGVSSDFFNAAFMTNGINKDYLKLDECVQLLPLVTKLVSSKYESNFRCGIKMVCMLFDMHSDNIRQCRRSQKIDPRTMDNYTKLINFFEVVQTLETIKTRNLNNDKNLKALLEEMKQFVIDCKK